MRILVEKKTFPHFPELDGLRGLAALAVFVSHFVQDQPIADGAPHILRVIRRLGDFGPLGVDVFFCLSGFLITSLLLVDRDKPSYFHDFYWKRVLRIVPVYVVHLLATALLFPGSGGYILLSILFIVNFASPLHVNVTGPAWSLSIEEQFYLVWPHVIRRMQLSRIYYVAFGLIAFSSLLRVAVPYWHGGVELKYTFYRCDGLALGALLACQWFSKESRNGLIGKGLSILNSNVTLVVLLVGETVLLVGYSHCKLMPQMNLTATNYLTYRLMRFIVTDRERGGRKLSWLASAGAVYLGKISYALYLFQSFVILGIGYHFGPAPPTKTGPVLIRAAIDLGVCIVICTISRFAMELPVQKLRRLVLRPATGAHRKAGSGQS